MKLIHNLDELPDDLRRGAVTIGNFDGVHRGHARIINQTIALAREVNGPAIVFTFDPHPVRILRPSAAPPPLTWTDAKAARLVELGVDSIIAYPTDEALLSLTAEEFFQQIIRDRLDARGMVEGPNFYFGRDRAGDIELLRGLCEQSGTRLEIVEPLKIDGDYVSSSRIRRLIAAGDVAAAGDLLTRPYRIRGMVTHGAGRGAKIGFPTANVAAIDTLLPAEGVYAAVADLGNQRWPAAVNIGPNPTFAEQQLKVEAHLIGYSGSLYGRPLELDFIARLRDVQPFPSVDALKQQLAADVAAAQQIAGA